ncbi:hypothetical protein Tco_1361242 [Tanacetum coccineum]
MMDGVKIGVYRMFNVNGLRGCAKHGSERIGPNLCFQVNGDVAGVRFRWTIGLRYKVHDDVAAIRFQRTTLAKGYVKLNVDSTEQTDGEAMINSILNGDHPLPVIAQVSLDGTAPNVPPTLKDPKF